MELASLALVAIGIVLLATGFLRAREPYRRYAALRDRDANVARYEAWRGGPRPDRRTGDSPALLALRARARRNGLVALAGIACIVAGFLRG